jgi:glycosyltransferase involved in cell wall biosynthesis
MSESKVDIIIPCYNTSSYLPQAIDAALKQSHKPITITVVDDGSTDRTKEVAQSYQGQVQYIYQENQGQAAARNTGIRNTSGKYVCLLDADDLIAHNMVERHVAILDSRTDVDISYSKTLAFNWDNTEFPYAEPWRPFVQWPDMVEPLSVICAIHICSMVIRRTAIERYGLFPEGREIQGCEDWYLWLLYALRGAGFHYVPEVLAFYRQHFGSSSSQEEAITRRETVLIRRAIGLFDELGISDPNRLRTLNYGVKATATRWAHQGAKEEFRNLLEASRGLAPEHEETQMVRLLSDKSNLPSWNLLYLALARGFLEMDRHEIASIMFLKTGPDDILRKTVNAARQKDLLSHVCKGMDDLVNRYTASEAHLESFSGVAHRDNFSWLGYVQCKLGTLNVLDGRLDEAEQRLRHALTLNPNYFYGYCLLADAVARKGKRKEALHILKEGYCSDGPGAIRMIIDRGYNISQDWIPGMGLLLNATKNNSIVQRGKLVTKEIITKTFGRLGGN